MIDALAVAIAFFRGDADLRLLTQDRIAVRHKYGMPESTSNPWPAGAQALTLQPTGGETPDDAGQIRVRLIAQGYGDDQVQAMQVVNRVRSIIESQGHTRQAVALPDGQTALLYWIGVADSPEFEKETDILNSENDRLDVARMPLRISVADTAI